MVGQDELFINSFIMVRFFETIYDYLSGKRWLVTVFLLLFVVGCAVLSLHMHHEEDIAKFLPQNEQNEKYAEIYQRLTRQDQIVIVFASRDTVDVVPSDTIGEAMDYFGETLQTFDSLQVIKDMQIRTDESQMLEVMDFIGQNAPYFLQEDDYRRMDSLLLQSDYIAEQMAENKQLLNLPAAGGRMESMRQDPLHLFSPLLSRMQAFRMTSSFDVIDGCVFTNDGRSALAFLSSPYGMSESAQNAALQSMLDSVMQLTEQEFPSLKVSAIGAPLVAAGNARQIKKDSVLAVSLAVVLILLLLAFHYRRLSDLWWLGCSLTFGWLFAMAGMSLSRDSVSVIVLGIGSVIIGIAVNYPLHFLDHLRETADTRQTLRDMVPPLLIGNITTVSAFLCLVWLDAAAMRDLGWFGSLMLIGTILFVLVFLPLYVSRKKPIQSLRTESPQASDCEYAPFGQGVRTMRTTLRALIILLITLVLGYFSTKTSFDSDLRNINYMTDQQREEMQLLSAVTREAPVYVVAEGKTLDDALKENETTVLPKIQTMQQEGSIRSVNGTGHFLPTKDVQEERISRWNQFWSQHAATVSAELKRQCVLQGFNEQAFAPFFEMIQTTYELQSSSYFDPIISLLNDTYIMNDAKTGKVQVVSYVQTDDEQTVKKVVNDTGSASSFAFSQQDVSNQLVRVLSDSFNYIGFVCGFVVFFFLWISFGSIELSLMSFLPLAVGWVWILGLMHLLGIQFNIVNVILATFIFGQGDDYTIFITEGLLYEYTTGKKRLASYKRSVALSAILMFIGIGTLIFAKHPALRSLAEVTIVGMFTVVLMAYYLPPMVFRWLTRGTQAPEVSFLTSRTITQPLPITLGRFFRSLFSIVFFLLMMYLFMLPFTWLYFHIGKNTEEKKLKYHRLLQKVSNFVIHRVPGVKFYMENRVGETFEKPAVVICNHQSHLDLMCLMMLTPRIVFLTNDWVWHNPFYGLVIHQAEFYPVSDGIEAHVDQLRSLYERGYSIAVFPEGTRSVDCSIQRFHKGAFYLAEQLQADILPIVLHGAGHVLPKKDFMLREGRIDMEVLERIRLDNPRFSSDLLTRTKQMRAFFKEHYAGMCERIETEDYWKSYQRYIEKYKI